MKVSDERKKLIEDICNYLMPIVSDLSEVESNLYIILNRYEIMSRCTELAEMQVDRNEFLLKRFLLAKAVQGCADRTLDFYRKSIKKILEEMNKTVDDITADDIRYYMAIRKSRDHVSKVTIGNEQRNLSSFFTWLHNEEYIQRNPMSKVARIKQDKTKKEALTEMEIEKIRMAARDEREKMIVEVLLSTGCRVNELVNIMLVDIDGDTILVQGKGAKERYVYLNARAQLAVETYIKKRRDQNPYLLPRGLPIAKLDKKNKKAKIEWWKEPNNVDVGHTDKGSVENLCRNMAKRAGVERANPHKFRRTCATLALRRGMPIEQVSKMLGHESIETTQIYLDLSEDELARAHKKYVV